MDNITNIYICDCNNKFWVLRSETKRAKKWESGTSYAVEYKITEHQPLVRNVWLSHQEEIIGEFHFISTSEFCDSNKYERIFTAFLKSPECFKLWVELYVIMWQFAAVKQTLFHSEDSYEVSCKLFYIASNIMPNQMKYNWRSLFLRYNGREYYIKRKRTSQKTKGENVT